MTVILPTPIPTTNGGLVFQGWRELQLHTEPATNGAVQLELPQVDPAETLLIDHMLATCDSISATQLRLYVNAVGALNLRDGSSRGNFDVADWPQGLLVRPSTTLVAQWTGASDGAIGVLTLQARVFRQG